MQQNVRGARRVGAGVVSDYAVEAIHGLDGIALEPPVQVLAGGSGEQAQQLPAHLHVEVLEALARAQRVRKLRECSTPATRNDIGRRLEYQLPQHICHGIEAARVLIEPRRILLRKLRDLGVRPPASHGEIPAVLGGKEVRQLSLDDAQPVGRQVQVPNDLRVEERHGVGRNRIAESRMKLLRHSSAAHDAAPLEHRDLESSGGEVRRANQTVVASADDEGVGRWDSGHWDTFRFRPERSIKSTSRADCPLTSWLHPFAGALCQRLCGISVRIRRPKLRRHTSPSLSGPTV